MDQSFDRFLLGAATIDERLSEVFEVVRGQKAEADAAGRRLAAWCRSSASGDWTLFAQRLRRDKLTIEEVLPRLATVRWKAEAPLPGWASDARWIVAAFPDSASCATIDRLHAGAESIAFEHLMVPIVSAAQERLWSGLPASAGKKLTDLAIASLCRSLAREVSDLCAPALFARFVETHADGPDGPEEWAPAVDCDGSGAATRSLYDRFVSQMRTAGLRDLFDEKPVLLRLVAVTVRQWIETTQELIRRLNADLPAIRECFVGPEQPNDDIVVTDIHGSMSDRHNGGRSVKLLRLSDGSQVFYKPKDLRLDAAWMNLVDRLNQAKPPVSLRAVRVLVRDGYGWTEFIDHCECSEPSDVTAFFQRAGAWLCLFHLFVGTDMHEQNMVAAGDHPVPIDLEMLLQSLAPAEVDSLPETEAAALAGQRIIESVTMTGLLPNYWRTPEHTLVGSGGLNNIRAVYTQVSWENINTDAMRPVLTEKKDDASKNLPSVKGEEVRLAEHVDALVSGFENYGRFLCQNKSTALGTRLFEGFDGLRTRRVLKNTRFYFLLLERLKDYRSMADGAEWSAQLDFVARFSDWGKEDDPLWPIVSSERQALTALCVPHFVSPTDGHDIADGLGYVAILAEQSGLHRARSRYGAFDSFEIQWQVEVIRLSTHSLAQSEDRVSVLEPRRVEGDVAGRDPSRLEATLFSRVARDIGRHLAELAIRRGDGASWIGLDWLGHSGLCRPTALGDDLYSGAPGVCLFLAAQARVFRDDEAGRLSLAGLSALRHNLHSANAPRFARAVGIGGATGLGSIVYALVATYRMLEDESLLNDARLAASLITDDLIAADWALDLFDGSAGCILSLLKLFEVTNSPGVIARAVKCGEHLLSRPRTGARSRSWLGSAVAERAPSKLSRPLNGMSHGAAGFAYALASLAKISGRGEFGRAAEECIAFENETFSEARSNWPDFRLQGSEAEPAWVCQWCHGAGGIGLARLGILRREALDGDLVLGDIQRAVRCAEAAWPYPGDNLCCGTLGNIDFLTEAGRILEVPALAGEASRRLAALLDASSVNGEYLFDGLDRRFNLGLFRGISGIGYSCLRQMSSLVPSVLIWD